MVTCLSPGGNNVTLSQEPSKLVLVGTTKGVYILQRRDSSKSWETCGQSIPQCHIHALVFEPSSGLIFAGVHKGTIYASADLGENWELRDKGITQPDVYCLNSVRVGEFVRLYAGTEPAHLFFSDELGKSWRELPSLRSVSSVASWDYPAPPHIAHVKYITFDPKEPETIYACIEQGALLRSRDGGSSWEELEGFYKDVHRLVVLQSDPRKMYLASGDGIYYSATAGASWQHLTDRSSRIGYPDALIVHPKSENLVFIAGAATIPPLWSKKGSADSRIGRSRDGGRTWDYPINGLPERIKGNIEAMAINVWNGSSLLYAATTDGEIFLSDNEGESWTTIATGLAPIAKRKHHLNFGNWPP